MAGLDSSAGHTGGPSAGLASVRKAVSKLSRGVHPFDLNPL